MDATPNKDLELACDLVERTGVNIFLTGKAGTGKTTFLHHLRENSSKRMVVLAPTGIAAINARGMTLHSFFQLDFAPFVPGARVSGRGRFDRFNRDKLRVIRSMDLLVIDEISMVRADLLDAVDDVLRRQRDPCRPFGGVQLLLIGDLQQLPPVVKDDEWQLLSQYYRSPFFFDSTALQNTEYVTVELKKVYRQNEGLFLDLLNRIRSNTADAAVIEALNRRCMPGFVPPEDKKYIRLTTHNTRAAAINERCLENLDTEERTYVAKVSGTFPESSYPAPERLTLKVGAQVMFIKNDPSGNREYYNGLIGEVTELLPALVRVRIPDEGRVTEVAPLDWENVKYDINPDTREIAEETVGAFTQMPLRTAWAITIHKSQGLTFDRAIIDAGDSFAHGQTYVALSRCRSLEGLVLDAPLRLSSLICDPAVGAFMAESTARTPSPADIDMLDRSYTVTLLRELFGCSRVATAFADLRRAVDEAFSSLFPKICAEFARTDIRLREDVLAVAARFARQFESLAMQSGCRPADNEVLQRRIHAGAVYFDGRMAAIADLVNLVPDEHDSAQLQKRLRERIGAISEALFIQRRLLGAFTSETFTTTGYLGMKAKVCLDIESPGKPKPGHKAARTDKSGKSHPTGRPNTGLPDDIENKNVYYALARWRREVAGDRNVPAFRIMPNRTLLAISDALPDTMLELKKVKGIGSQILREFGRDILEVVARADE